jgi:hypothetical protein
MYILYHGMKKVCHGGLELLLCDFQVKDEM